MDKVVSGLETVVQRPPDAMRLPVISLLCPTRGRPQGASRLIESVIASAAAPARVEILFYVDDDDPACADYAALFSDCPAWEAQLADCRAFLGPPMSVSRSWNVIAEACHGDILVIANDDQVFNHAGWDRRLAEEAARFADGIYCIWFDDGINGEKHCAFPIVSRTWYETLGYLTPGIFEFIGNDTWIMDVAARVGRLHYVGDVTVEHRHFSAGKAAFDDTYQRHRTGEARHRIRDDLALFERAAPLRARAAEQLRAVMTPDAPSTTSRVG